METSFLSTAELQDIGFKKLGHSIFISRFARFYSPDKISIGSNVRIDDFCILSGEVTVGNYVHIAAHSVLTGGVAGIDIDDFAGLSQRVNVFASSDDYSGEYLTNPLVPDTYKKVLNARVKIKKHAVVGCGAVLLPGTVLNEGTAVGALSLVNTITQEWTIYVGIPAKPIKPRSKGLLKFERSLKSMENKEA